MSIRILPGIVACLALCACNEKREPRNPPSAPIVGMQSDSSTKPGQGTVSPADAAPGDGDDEDWSKRLSLPVLEGRLLRPIKKSEELEGSGGWLRERRQPQAGNRLPSSADAERAALKWIEEQFGKLPDSAAKLVVESVNEDADSHTVRLVQKVHGIPASGSWIEIDKDGVLSASCALCRFEIVPDSTRDILTRDEAVDAKFHTFLTEHQALADVYKQEARLSYVEVRSGDWRSFLDIDPNGNAGPRTRWVPEWELDPMCRYTMKAFRKGQSAEARAREEQERADAWKELTKHEADEDWTTLATLPVLRGKPIKPPDEKIVEYSADNVGFMRHSELDSGWEYRTARLRRRLGRMESKDDAIRLATDWLAENFGRFPPPVSLVVQSVDEHEDQHQIEYEQRYHGIRVDCHASVDVDSKGIQHANGVCLYQIEMVPDSARRVVTKEAAVETWYRIWLLRDESEAEALKQKAEPRLIYRHADFSDFENQEEDNGDDDRSIHDKDDRLIPAYEVDPEGILMIDAFTGRAWYND